MQAESFCASYSIYHHMHIYDIFTEMSEIRLRYMIIINASEKSYWTIVACSNT